MEASVAVVGAAVEGSGRRRNRSGKTADFEGPDFVYYITVQRANG